VVIDNGSGNLPTTGISSIPLRNKGELTIYPRMVETEEAMQLTDEIVSRPDLFHQYKVQGFNNKRRLQAQYHHEATDDFDSPQISLQQSYHIEGKTNIQYTFFEVISRLFEYTVQGSSVKHRGNHCQGVYNGHSMSSARRRNFVYQKAASRDHPT
jgi:hypothetical protein